MRLREIKKALDNGQGLKDADAIAYECMSEIVELCSGELLTSVSRRGMANAAINRLYWQHGSSKAV